MKIMKKISVVLLSLCLCIPCFSMVAYAADGRISFTDPETAVGEVVEVKCVVRSTSGNMGDVEVVLDYDSEALRFDSGADVSDDGNGTLTCTSTGGSAELTFTIQFQALSEGETKVSVSSATIADANGASLTLDQGNSTVKIAEGDPSKITETEGTAADAEDIQVEVNGVSYTLTDSFADTDIPNGYSRTQLDLDGQERQMVTNDSGSVYLGYLKDASGVGDFFLFSEEDATFKLYEEISISDTASIIVLSDTSKVSLPTEYQEAKLSLNGKEFPVWKDTVNEGFFVIYAMNNSGEEGYYRYDSVENTYQRFEPEAVAEEVADETDTSSLLGKVEKFVKDNLAVVVLAGGLGAILLLLILIIVSIKLHNRNAELDELYDEYGIDMEEESVDTITDEKDKKVQRAKKQEEIEEDFEEDFEEDTFEDVDFEEDFEEEDFEEEDFEEEQIEEDVFAGYDTRSEIMIDDLDALLSEHEPKKRGHMETDDTFKVDFIDLD